MLVVASIVAVAIVAVVILFYGYYVWLLATHPMPTAADEVHTVTTRDGWKIQLYRMKSKNVEGQPVFLCHSLVSNHLSFAVPEGEGIVHALVKAGYDCWCIDLRGCRSAVPPRGAGKRGISLDDYLLKDIPAAIEYIRRETGYNKVHWIGHSLGGMLLYAFDLTFGSACLASGVAIGSPPSFKNIQYESPSTLLSINGFSPLLVNTSMKLIAPFSSRLKPNLPVLPINWINVHPKIGTTELIHLVEPIPPQVGIAMNQWATGSPWVMSGGSLKVGERLDEVSVPLLTIYGGGDPFTPIGNAELLLKRLKISDKKMVVLSRAKGYSEDYSHMDLAFAKNGRIEVCQPIIDWLNAHATDEAHYYEEDAQQEGESVVLDESPLPPEDSSAHRSPRAKSKSAARKPAVRRQATRKTPPSKKAAVKKPAARKKRT
ncbi:MAG: hypothetical protein AMXMBFR84_46210 [Candidatus Hydrogenedentota bacterium]